MRVCTRISRFKTTYYNFSRGNLLPSRVSARQYKLQGTTHFTSYRPNKQQISEKPSFSDDYPPISGPTPPTTPYHTSTPIPSPKFVSSRICGETEYRFSINRPPNYHLEKNSLGRCSNLGHAGGNLCICGTRAIFLGRHSQAYLISPHYSAINPKFYKVFTFFVNRKRRIIV